MILLTGAFYLLNLLGSDFCLPEKQLRAYSVHKINMVLFLFPAWLPSLTDNKCSRLGEVLLSFSPHLSLFSNIPVYYIRN